MGMELIELVMELENRFEIRIPDEDYEKIMTVGGTVAYVVSCLRQKVPPPMTVCPSARLFYRLRREMVAELGVARRAVTPAARLGDLVPAGPARLRWDAVADQCGLDREPLYLSRPSRSRFPPEEMTVRNLIDTRTRHRRLGRGQWYRRNGEVDEAAVWRGVCAIVSKVFGARADDLKWDTHYIDDLFAG